MNPGKIFEEDFRTSASKVFPSVDINRLKDPTGGRSGVRNICDFIMFVQPHIFYLELKNRQGNTLNFNDITKDQWLGLKEKAKVRGAIPGIVINYSDYNEAYFVHISDLVHLKEQGKKSLHIDYARMSGVKMPSTRKRTRFTYHVDEFLNEVGVKFG